MWGTKSNLGNVWRVIYCIVFSPTLLFYNQSCHKLLRQLFGGVFFNLITWKNKVENEPYENKLIVMHARVKDFT